MNEYNDIYEIISLNIKKYRKEKGITQEELAIRSRYTWEFIRRIESKKAKKSFSLSTLVNIANALEIPIEKLLKKEESEK